MMWNCKGQEDYWSQTVWDSDNDEEDARISSVETEIDSDEEAAMYAHVHHHFEEIEEKNSTLELSTSISNEIQKPEPPVKKMKQVFQKPTRRVDKIFKDPAANLNEVYGTKVSQWSFNENSEVVHGVSSQETKSRLTATSKQSKSNENFICINIASSTSEDEDSDVQLLDELFKNKRECRNSKQPRFVVAEISSDESSDNEVVTIPTDIHLHLKNQTSKPKQKSPSPVSIKPKRKTVFENNSISKNSSEESKQDVQTGSEDRSLWNINATDRFPEIRQNPRYFRDIKMRVRCNNCKQYGHLSKVCPDPKKIPHCYLCGEAYHSGERCKNAICGICMKTGHVSKRCKTSHSQLNNRFCNSCNMKGHIVDVCPNLWRRYHLTISPGEIIRGQNKVNPRVFCFNCSKQGHWGHECQRPRFDRTTPPAYPFIISYDEPKQQQQNHEPKSKKRKIQKTKTIDVVIGKSRKKPKRIVENSYKSICQTWTKRTASDGHEVWTNNKRQKWKQK